MTPRLFLSIIAYLALRAISQKDQAGTVLQYKTGKRLEMSVHCYLSDSQDQPALQQTQLEARGQLNTLTISVYHFGNPMAIMHV